MRLVDETGKLDPQAGSRKGPLKMRRVVASAVATVVMATGLAVVTTQDASAKPKVNPVCGLCWNRHGQP